MCQRHLDWGFLETQLFDCMDLTLMNVDFIKSFWAAIPTNSNGLNDKGWERKSYRLDIDDDEEGSNAIGPILLSRSGLRYLERAEELTHAEVQTLLQSGLPPSQYTYMLMQWVGM